MLKRKKHNEGNSNNLSRHFQTRRQAEDYVNQCKAVGLDAYLNQTFTQKYRESYGEITLGPKIFDGWIVTTPNGGL